MKESLGPLPSKKELSPPSSPASDKEKSPPGRANSWVGNVLRGRFGKHLKIGAAVTALGGAEIVRELKVTPVQAAHEVAGAVSYGTESIYQRGVDTLAQRVDGGHESFMPLRVSGFERAGIRSEDMAEAVHTIFPGDLLRGQVFEISMADRVTPMAGGFGDDPERPGVTAGHCYTMPHHPAKIEFGSNMADTEPRELLRILVHEVAHKIFDPDASGWLPEPSRQRIHQLLRQMVQNNQQTNYTYPDAYRQMGERLFVVTEGMEEDIRETELLAELVEDVVTHNIPGRMDAETWYTAMRDRWQRTHDRAPQNIEAELEIIRIICEARGDLLFFSKMQKRYRTAVNRLEQRVAERAFETAFQGVFHDPALAALSAHEVMQIAMREGYVHPIETEALRFIHPRLDQQDPSSGLDPSRRRRLELGGSGEDAAERVRRFNEGVRLVRDRYDRERTRALQLITPDQTALREDEREDLDVIARMIVRLGTEHGQDRTGQNHEIRAMVRDLLMLAGPPSSPDDPNTTGEFMRLNRLTDGQPVLQAQVRQALRGLVRLYRHDHTEPWTPVERELVEFTHEILRNRH